MFWSWSSFWIKYFLSIKTFRIETCSSGIVRILKLSDKVILVGKKVPIKGTLEVYYLKKKNKTQNPKNNQPTKPSNPPQKHTKKKIKQTSTIVVMNKNLQHLQYVFPYWYMKTQTLVNFSFFFWFTGMWGSQYDLSLTKEKGINFLILFVYFVFIGVERM